jgi:hypothetical protein
MSQNPRFGLLPIIDGPWKGGKLDQGVGTFEVEGDGDDGYSANPLTLSAPGVERVRYYRQAIAGRWCWSTVVPDNEAELLQEEYEACAALLSD